MDRLNQMRREAGGSRDSTLDTSSPPSESFMTANESSSKYYSLSEVDSTFDISSIKDVSLATTATEAERTITNSEELISNLSPIGKKSDILDTYKIDTQIEAANILSGGVAIFDENSYDGNELVIDDNVEDDKSNPELKQTESLESNLITEDAADIASKDTEVVLQIDGKNVDAIDIGNGLYLYRKEGQEELAAVQIIDDDHQQPSFKFLKVRENAEGNLEVYEEIEIEVPKEVPAKEEKTVTKGTSSHVPIKDINKVISESNSSKVADKQIKAPRKELPISTVVETESKEASPESKAEVNFNGKMMKLSESRKSPVIGSFTPMTYHSTPKKEGKPLTKTMVDQQLHPNRHSDLTNAKKTIEVHTDSCKKTVEMPSKCKDIDITKINEVIVTDKETTTLDPSEKNVILEVTDSEIIDIKDTSDVMLDVTAYEINKTDEKSVSGEITKDKPEQKGDVSMEQDNAIDSTEKEIITQKVEEDAPSKAILEDEKIEETKTSIEKSIPVNDTVEESIKVDGKTLTTTNTKNDDTYKAISVDNETELIIIETEEPCVKEPVFKDNTQIEQEDTKKFEEVAIDLNEPILIEDDDVSVVEVTVYNDSKSEKENESTDGKVETKIDEDKSKICDNVAVLSKDSTKASIDEKPKKDLITPNSFIEPELDNKTVTTFKDEDKKTTTTFTEIKNDSNKDTLSSLSQNKILIDTISSPPMDIKSKKIEQIDKIDVLVKSSISESKQILSKAAENIQNKPIESLESKNAPLKEGTVKHISSANISPLLEQKQQSLVAPRVLTDKSVLPEKTEDKKPSASVYNVTLKSKIEQNIESKSVETIPKNIPVKAIQLTRPIAAVTHMQVYSGHVPISVAKISTKNNPVSIVGSGVEIKKNVIPPPIKNISVDKPRPALDIKPSTISQRDDKKDCKVPPKTNVRDKATCVMNIEISKVPKLDSVKIIPPIKQTDVSTASNFTNPSLKNKKDVSIMPDTKLLNNNHAAVPFGKWTDANRQEFLNKFKIKASVAPPLSTNQLKNSNDLNRRDVLKKIDSQRQSSTALSKSQESGKHSMKSDNAAFSNKPTIIAKEITQESKISLKTEISEVKPKDPIPKTTTKIDVVTKSQNEPEPTTVTNLTKKEMCQTKGNVQNLIDKTIEGMIHRNAPVPKAQNEPKKNISKEKNIMKEPAAPKPADPPKVFQPIQPPSDAKLDEIEMKMNELHGIPFIERPAHELPQLHKPEPKTNSNIIEMEKPAGVQVKTKIPNLLPFPNKVQQKVARESALEVDSEDEIIEHEPITGDIDVSNKNQMVKPPAKEKLPIQPEKSTLIDASKKDSIITEKDFDKFARRNSITYENRLTVNFDGKEPHNVVQTVVEKEPNPKKYSRNDTARIDSKSKLPIKCQNTRPITQPVKENRVSKFAATSDDTSNKNQSKLQKAYYSALTEKQQMKSDCAITIIEDKPVQVLFVNNAEYTTPATPLNFQGQDLSPSRPPVPDPDVIVTTGDSHDSDVLDSTEEGRSQDDVRTKTKHQRKQVLTPVEEPELELIEPRDLGIEVSPKKKRRIDDDKTDKNVKYPMRKKYLLGSSTQEKVTNPVDVVKNPLKVTVNINDNGVAHQNPISALDSLVKAAELIETQTENMNTSSVSNSDSQSSTPVKRGRGRPRKYPLTPDGNVDKSKLTIPSPQKKPRLIDAITPKRQVATDDSDSDGELIKENWTMGKIDENIVCPICNKLFRTENVVFKHVKHCTGPSPSRSDSDKTSPRRMRISQDSDSKSQESKSDDIDIDDDKPLSLQKLTPKKCKSKDSRTKSVDKDDVIVIEDTPPAKEKPEITDERKHHVSRKSRIQIPLKNNLVCEFCGKTFRQLSYLVSHKLQHKKPEKVEPKKTEKLAPIASKSVFSCEVCKKEFRKLHHLVQHRIIHNPSTVPARSSRKSSSEQSESKVDKEPSTSKQSDDPSAGFRCEPCDKSFRKLHHLVEHRETHDGKNRQKTSTAPASKEEKPVEKPIILHQCDVCKKTFKKLIQLNEHKEQHVETCSEKSDDKSVKSALSTKDIIHECSLCYMVFPNEHSLNKHTIICQRKKRQSKQVKPTDDTDGVEEVTESPTPDEKIELIDSPKADVKEVKPQEEKLETVQQVEPVEDKPTEIPDKSKDKSIQPVKIVDKEDTPQIIEVKPSEPPVSPSKRSFAATESSEEEVKPEVPEKIKKVEHKEPAKTQETPKKKTQLKDKPASATKRLKNTTTPTSVTEKIKPAVESGDDDDVRYMLNPNFKAEEVTVEKVFMKVRAEKRSSLQIERPDSKDLMKRRTSLQHPPKIPRLKPKPIEVTAVKKEVKTPKVEPVLSTDSDDSDTTKYSFPATIVEKHVKSAQNRTPKDSGKKTQKKPLVDKRKSLSGIAKRKSLGKAVIAKHKLTPLKQIKKRMLDAGHRCDCGQLFSSAALLSRHTSLAHTPPRIRRRRSPSPDVKPPVKDKPVAKPAPRKSVVPEKPKPVPASRKSTGRSVSGPTKSLKAEVKPGRKTLDKLTKSPSELKKAKPEKAEEESSVKPRRTGAHRGVPVPEKMRKLLEKNK